MKESDTHENVKLGKLGLLSSVFHSVWIIQLFNNKRTNKQCSSFSSFSFFSRVYRWPIFTIIVWPGPAAGPWPALSWDCFFFFFTISSPFLPITCHCNQRYCLSLPPASVTCTPPMNQWSSPLLRGIFFYLTNIGVYVFISLYFHLYYVF